MSSYQPGILADVPPHGLYLTFRLRAMPDPGAVLACLQAIPASEDLVLGLGSSLVAVLGASIDGLRPLEVHATAGAIVPSTPSALWCWLRGEDPGQLLHQEKALRKHLDSVFCLEDATASFRFKEGRDLTGYVDGTENPTDGDALEAAFTSGKGPGLDGGSFVAVQRWVHDLDGFQAMSPHDRDHTFGRQISDNEEIEDAPKSAHVKRTAQEDFEPPAFMLRRSMPWSDPRGNGLIFVSFGHSLSAFERQMRRMVGSEDGIVDALFGFSRPVSGASYWCPPVRDGAFDLSALNA